MEVVPDEVDTCKDLRAKLVRTKVVAGKGWCLLFGACGDCCLQVLKTSAALIVVLFGRVGARETC
jgi:hypothetical protein